MNREQGSPKADTMIELESCGRHRRGMEDADEREPDLPGPDAALLLRCAAGCGPNRAAKGPSASAEGANTLS